MAKLTDRQEMFCFEFIKDLNGKQAAIRAGYSEKTAKEQASRLLTNVNVLDRIAELKAERVERLEIDADKVLQEVYWLATSRVTDVIGIDNGKVVVSDTEDLPDNVKASIASIGETTAGITIKMHSKTDALEKLMKHLGLYEKDNEQGKDLVNVTVNID